VTNLQLLLSIGIPSLLVLVNIALNKSDVGNLRSDVIALRSEMTQMRVDINRDMAQLRDSIHRDMIGLHERVAVVEAKQA
jgi:hypothetical protein